MKFLIALLFLLICTTYSCSKNNVTPSTPSTPSTSTGDVSAYMTTTNQLSLLAQQDGINFSKDPGDFTITLDSTTLYQSIDGYGAALTGSSAYLLQQLPQEQRTSELKNLFDPSQGIGISYLRICIGASDFSLGNYSYCDTPPISNFAIPAIDQRDLIPTLKEILTINPNLTILATPWSAPGWMKDSQKMNGGNFLSAKMSDLADYFVKYIQVYASQGIKINAISLQNEPLNSQTGYPTMYMSWQQQDSLIRYYVGPRFLQAGITTKILIYDHNWDHPEYPLNILNNPQAYQYIAGSAFHAYAGSVSAMSQVHNAFPDKGVYFTEQSGGGWDGGFASDLIWFSQYIFIGTANNWSKNALTWNLALNQNDGPQNGGCTNCRGVITIDNRKITPNVEYYCIGHFSKFVRPGAHRIRNTVSGAQPSTFYFATFMNTDGSKVVVSLNSNTASTSYVIRCGQRQFLCNQLGQSVVTYTWK